MDQETNGNTAMSSAPAAPGIMNGVEDSIEELILPEPEKGAA